jgi:hypothetical protein
LQQSRSVSSCSHWDDILDTEAKREKLILNRFRRDAFDNHSVRFGIIMLDEIERNFMLFQEGLQVEVILVG